LEALKDGFIAKKLKKQLN